MIARQPPWTPPVSTIRVPIGPHRHPRDLLGRWRHRRFRSTLRRVRHRDPAPTAATLLRGREQFEDMGVLMGAPAGAPITDAMAGDVPVQWIDRRGSGRDPLDGDGPVVFYAHGGAYAMGSIVASRHALDPYLRQLDALGLSVQYRLAPEHPWPAGLDDLETAWHWLVERVDPRRVFAIGESAGGGLLLSLLTRLRDQGAPLPAAAVTISAWANLAMDTPSYVQRRDRDLALDVRLLRHAADAYLAGGADPSDPTVSPVHADLSGLPPLLLVVGTEEVVWDDSMALHQRALDAGVEARLLVGDGQLHCFTGYADHLPAAREAVQHVTAFAEEHLRPRPRA